MSKRWTMEGARMHVKLGAVTLEVNGFYITYPPVEARKVYRGGKWVDEPKAKRKGRQAK